VPSPVVPLHATGSIARVYDAERIALKRIPLLPRTAHTVSITDNSPETIVPKPYETTI
jgi:hypothetical protein